MKKRREKNLESVVSMTVAMLIGIILLVFWIKGFMDSNKNIKEYIITNDDGNILWFVLGFMFFFIPLVMLMSESGKKNDTKKIKKFKNLITSVLFGITFLGIGIGFYYIMCSATDSFLLATVFKTFGIFAIIPVIFAILGIIVILASLFSPKGKEVILYVEKITEFNNGEYDIVLADVSIDRNSIKAITNKYYVYRTKNKEKFKQGKEYMVNIYKYGVMFEGVQISPKVQARYLKLFVDNDFEAL